MDVHVYVHLVSADAVLAKLDDIMALIRANEVTMSAELDTLTTKVNETVSVEASAILLLNGLSAQIAALKGQPEQLQALADSLSTKSAELAAAIAANSVPG